MRPRGIGDPPQANPRHIREASQEPPDEDAFVLLDRVHPSHQRSAPVAHRCAFSPSSETGHVFDGCDEARDGFVRKRARLPSLRRPVVLGTNLVRGQGLEQRLASPHDSQMWAEELVGRTEEDVDAERPDVDQSMRGEMDRVRHHDRSRRALPYQADDLVGGNHGPYGVRCQGEGDHRADAAGDSRRAAGRDR